MKRLLLASALCTLTLAFSQGLSETALQSAPSPAQSVFDEVNSLLQNQYGGLSTISRTALTAEYQQRLNAVCAPTLINCDVQKAYPVLSAEITALKDDHSYFQDPGEFSDFVASATGGNRLQFGVRLAQFNGEARLVLEVVPGSVSEEVGIKRGDVLSTIDGQPYTYNALKAAREAGRAITLGLTRTGQALHFSVTARESSTRDLPQLSYVSGASGANVAVLRIPTFLSGGGVAQTVHNEVREAQQRGAAGLIVDLRGNAGGDLSECDGAASAFVPQFTRLARTAFGTARTVVSGGARLEDGRARGDVRNPVLWTGPLAVMVDGGSASCSEFFAYELQYAGRATIVGETTAGVGNTATRVFPVQSGAALQLTILNYAKPDGTPYPVSVKPDVDGKTDVLALSSGQDTLLSKALSVLPSAPALNADDLSRL